MLGRRTITTSNFNEHVIIFCNSDRFKVIVRETFNEESFWKEFIRNLKIENLISTTIKDKMSKVKIEVATIKTDAKRDINNDIQQKFREHMDTIAGKVARELSIQIPAYLSNHHQMQQILSSHKSEVEKTVQEHLAKALIEIENKTRSELERIVNEDDYHNINKAYFDAFTNKGDRLIKDLQLTHTSLCQKQQEEHNQMRANIQQKCIEDMTSLKDGLQKLDETRQKVNRLSKKLENSNN